MRSKEDAQRGEENNLSRKIKEEGGEKIWLG